MVGLVRQWTSDQWKLRGGTRDSSLGTLRVIKGQAMTDEAPRCSWRGGKYESMTPAIAEAFRCAKDVR